MSMNHKEKVIDDLRHNEYYATQKRFDELYAQSKNGQSFENLVEVILEEDNILLAYRNIKSNGGSNTPGTDGLSIKDIAKLSANEVVEKVRFILTGSKHGYRPKPVRRKEIPKPNGKTRPLGIPCIWDRLVQQCIKQVMEPIAEAKFSDNSFGFRPIRDVENAIARTYRMLQLSNLYHVIEFDIEGFFDNVNHSKLIKQIWQMGIHDKKLIAIIKRILKAPIKLEDGKVIIPEKGTPQGGIISPLLANIVLNELDQWIESQWQYNPVTLNYRMREQKNGTVDRGHGYRAMKDSTNLKEMWIVRYADDFRIFCRKKSDAEKVLIATTDWLKQRLKLNVSAEKTRIVDVRNRYMEFLGFKIKVTWNNPKNKYVVISHISDKALKSITEKLVDQAKKLCDNEGLDNEVRNITLYNSMVLGMQNYYRIATCVASDLHHVQQLTYRIMYNRLNTQTGNRFVRKGRQLTELERQRYGKSKSLRFVKGTNEPVYPIYYVQFKNPIAFNRRSCVYTSEGRAILHENLRAELKLLPLLRNNRLFNESIEFFDNRLSLYSAQYGKCHVLGKEFDNIEEIHCHHKKPKHLGGTDEYKNLVLIDKDVHKLVHAIKVEIILNYLEMLELNAEQLRKVNRLRYTAELQIIKTYNIKEHKAVLEFAENYIDF